MAWCPKCENEYRQGTVTCTDCGEELVENLEKGKEPELLYIAENRTIADKFASYLEYSHLLEYEIRENEFKEAEIYLPPEAITEARKLLIGFQVALQNETLEDIPGNIELPENQEEQILKEAGKENFRELQRKKSSVYIKAMDKYTDMKFSAISFISFGIGGILFVILNLVKVIDFINLFSSVTMGGVFIVFLIIGVSTMKKANLIKGKIGEEESQTDSVKSWMHDHFTNSYYNQLTDTRISPEKQYFEVMEKLMQQITEAFPNVDPDYLEQLTDESYNTYLEHYGD